MTRRTRPPLEPLNTLAETVLLDIPLDRLVEAGDNLRDDVGDVTESSTAPSTRLANAESAA